MGYGRVEIVNIFSKLDTPVSVDMVVEEMTDKDNDKYILQSVESTDKTILAFGQYSNTNKKVKERQEAVIKLLSKQSEKLYTIEDATGRVGWHPLAPQVRHAWKLSKFKIKEESTKQPNKAKKELV